ncbi:MAG: 2-C-methyl-D-erythritol 4-phosphate cytidylyltransferase, partial [Deltaproteobacteria bacterium]|nr:2-C-methyl-D-erythritol 4-phosphate cytidylyltransferase [Deltaproteobacteria bacterium]
MPRSQFSVTALIPAAGASSRMGGGPSKALLEFDGSTAIQRVVAEIFASDYVRRFIVLAPAEALPAFKALPFGPAQVRVELGGATRQESVQKGIQYICEEEVTPDFVLVHDAARCLVSRQLVEATIEAAFTYKAVTAAVPLVDSLVRVDRSNQ